MKLTEPARRAVDPTRARPPVLAAALGVLLTASFVLAGGVWTTGNLVVASASSCVLLFSVLLLPVQGKAPMTLDGCSDFRRAKNSQLWLGVFVAFILGIFMDAGMAAIFGIASAIAMGADGRGNGNGRAESQGER